MKLEQTWRWFGPFDTITLQDVKQTGATGVVTALHHLPIGEIWPIAEIERHRKRIEDVGLRWSVVESLPIHEDIKRRVGRFEAFIENYKQSLRNIGASGIRTVCYNFMPVLDWTRTDLDYPLPDGSTALRFDETVLAAFDLFILKRSGAEAEYLPAVAEAAERLHRTLDSAQKATLSDVILMGLPGSEEGYTFPAFQAMLESYRGISPAQLRRNLQDFLRAVVPAAEEAGVRLAIHPDDPPFPILGLPRVVSTEEDARALLEVADTPYNGLTFCTGSYGARADNDLPGMVDRLGHRVNFIHLRSVQREAGRTFYEANHLEGDVDMAAVMAALIREQQRRIDQGRTDVEIPMRPDHGHAMLSDLQKKSFPGYSCIGRLRALAELRGLELGLRAGIAPTSRSCAAGR